MSDQKQEDALDLALSGQIKAGRVIDSASALIAGQAFEFRLSHTVGGVWPDNELEAKAEHDAMLELVGELGRLKRSCSEIPNDWTGKLNSCRFHDDDRAACATYSGQVPCDAGHSADDNKMVDMARIAKNKIKKMGGTPCGLLVRNEAGALAAVSDMGRVAWLDDCVMVPVARDEDVALPKQAAGAQGDAEKEAEKEESKGDFPLKEESLIRKAARAQGDAEPVAWLSDAQETEQKIDGRPRRVWWECKKGVGTPFCTRPPSAGVPDGWKLVPEEPTPEMREAFFKAQEECEDFEGVYGPVMPDHQYSAMLSVAPQPPQEGE